MPQRHPARSLDVLPRSLALGALVLALMPGPAVEAGELAGVTLADTARVGEQTLVLNGLGLRKKAIFKVYVGGLYLPSKSRDADAILSADQPRRMVLEFVRSVGSDSIAGAWSDCLEANVPGASQSLSQRFERLSGWMADVESGDQLVFTYDPGSGTEVQVRGATEGTLEGKDFADALFACWIGAHPPSEDFREGLLGN